MNISQVIVKPVLTEKSVRGELQNKYTFIVHEDATKVDVKLAIKQLFGATVDQVNIKKGAPKFRWGKGRRPMQKRASVRQAIVTLKAGEKLDLGKVAEQDAKPKAKKAAPKSTKETSNKSE